MGIFVVDMYIYVTMHVFAVPLASRFAQAHAMVDETLIFPSTCHPSTYVLLKLSLEKKGNFHLNNPSDY